MSELDRPRLALAAEPLPDWLLVARRFLRKTQRGGRRLWHGCVLRHSPDLLARPRDGVIDYECPRCSLIVRTLSPEPSKIRPWNEKMYQRSKNPEKYDNVTRFTK